MCWFWIDWHWNLILRSMFMTVFWSDYTLGKIQKYINRVKNFTNFFHRGLASVLGLIRVVLHNTTWFFVNFPCKTGDFFATLGRRWEPTTCRTQTIFFCSSLLRTSLVYDNGFLLFFYPKNYCNSKPTTLRTGMSTKANGISKILRALARKMKTFFFYRTVLFELKNESGSSHSSFHGISFVCWASSSLTFFEGWF